MFDLFPDTSHLMLDLELQDPFDRHVAVLGLDSRSTNRRVFSRATLDDARHAIGRSLIAVGSALAVDENHPSQSPAR